MTTTNSATANDLFGLKQHTISAIQKVFVRHPAIRQAVLYGSRAKGPHRPGSDIDLTLFGEALTYTGLKQKSMIYCCLTRWICHCTRRLIMPVYWIISSVWGRCFINVMDSRQFKYQPLHLPLQ
ncbi:MAG: nucleotidyltransferase domain-containing protein [Methylobacter sp.]|nr:nucleotidyltransferase domain-containing protein [Methylobacter sp.]